MSDTREQYPFCDGDPAPIRAFQLRADDASPSVETDDVPAYREDTADALRWVLNWMLASRNAPTIGARALLLASVFGVDHKLNKSFTSIADAAGCSRESVRQAARSLEDFAGLRTAHNRTDSTRSACRQSRLAVIKREREREVLHTNETT